MKGFTHFCFACFIGFLIIQIFNLSILTLIPVIFASLLPDLDTKKSVLGKHFKIFNFFLDHRGIFHSLFFTLFITNLTYIFFGLTYAIMAGIGIMTHLFLDSLTPAGVYPFYPIKWKIRSKFKTGGVGDLFTLLISIIGIDCFLMLIILLFEPLLFYLSFRK